MFLCEEIIAVTPEAAQVVAIQALAWLVGNDELLPVFMGSTGTSAKDLKARVEDTSLLVSVMDFILMEDQWVLDFCDVAGIDPYKLQSVRYALPGGEIVHWT